MHIYTIDLSRHFHLIWFWFHLITNFSVTFPLDANSQEMYNCVGILTRSVQQIWHMAIDVWGEVEKAVGWPHADVIHQALDIHSESSRQWKSCNEVTRLFSQQWISFHLQRKAFLCSIFSLASAHFLKHCQNSMCMSWNNLYKQQHTMDYLQKPIIHPSWKLLFMQMNLSVQPEWKALMPLFRKTCVTEYPGSVFLISK